MTPHSVVGILYDFVTARGSLPFPFSFKVLLHVASLMDEAAEMGRFGKPYCRKAMENQELHGQKTRNNGGTSWSWTYIIAKIFRSFSLAVQQTFTVSLSRLDDSIFNGRSLNASRSLRQSYCSRVLIHGTRNMMAK
jgi:hypothetical protein